MKINVILALALLSNVGFGMDLRTANWQSDLTYYKENLEKKHIDLYHKIDKDTFEAELNNIRESIKQLSDWEIAISLMRLTRKIGDGHTSVSLTRWNNKTFPITVKKISNKWRIVKIDSEHSDLLGASLETIDGVRINDVERKLSTVSQFIENENSELVRIGNYMPFSEILHALQITDSPQRAVFGLVTEEGKVLLPLTALSERELDKVEQTALTVGAKDIVKPDSVDFDFLWYSTIKTTKATYIRFDSYPAFDEMMLFVEKLLVFMEQNQSQQVVIDLRNNGGGDLYVGLVLASALNLIDSIDWKDGVYALTSGVTFSAGASNAALFRQLLNATIVGTPTGSNPTGYQDMGSFVLQNSKLEITYSKRLLRLQKAVTSGVEPDIELEQSWLDYSTGKDTVLNKVIELLK